MLKAYHALHQKAGMEHDNHSGESDSHILYDKMEKKAYIINFSQATLEHKCGLRLDLYEKYAGVVPDPVFGCRELLLISRLVGMTKSISCKRLCFSITIS